MLKRDPTGATPNPFVEKLRREWESSPIAVIGMACRFPGAPNLEAFHRLLRTGGSGIREVPADRWDAEAFYAPEPATPGKMCTKRGGFVDGLDELAADFFGMSPREAKAMDPQQRLLLAVAWDAFAHAAIAPDRLAKTRTGVYIATSTSDWAALSAHQPASFEADALTILGKAVSVAAGRLSYLLNLNGPCMVTDTSCSSSLTALHQACNSLRNGESDCVIVGAVNAVLDPRCAIALSQGGFLSTEGECKTFDARANGFVRSEGCGVVLLKRLADARRQGARVLAVIRGSAINHDGRSQGLTAPNGHAQQQVVRRAMSAAGIGPSDVQYVEAHGTGTSLGDPQELDALGQVFAARSASLPRVVVGSVKTNIGHLEAAAGMAGFIKVVLALEHREIFPHINYEQTNPHIRLEHLSIAIPTSLRPWLPNHEHKPRIAGVSGFGISGTNGHVIVEEATSMEEVRASEGCERPVHVLALSARTQRELRGLARSYREHLRAYPSEDLADFCFTANTSRMASSHRAAVLVASLDQAAAELELVETGLTPTTGSTGQCPPGSEPKLAFVFTGQGAQYAGMAKDLYEKQPTFRRALDQCDAMLKGRLPETLMTLIGRQDRIGETAYAQPALFAVEWALAELWRTWGVTPNAVMGHSLGEYVAACVAGSMALEDALYLVAERGRLMQSVTADGLMLAIEMSAESVAELIAPFASSVSLAARNGPAATVISGARKAVESIEAVLQTSGVRTRRLETSHAFHSPHMDPILDDFERIVGTVGVRRPQRQFVSTVTGKSTSGGELSSPAYWCRQIRQPVSFDTATRSLLAEGFRLFVEVGPDPVLTTMARAFAEEGDFLPSLRRDRGDFEQLLETVAALQVRGVGIDWHGFDVGYPRRRVVLPSLPLEKKAFPLPRWIGLTDAAGATAAPAPHLVPAERERSRLGTLDERRDVGSRLHPFLGRRIRLAGAVAVFENRLTLDDFPFLRDCRVFGRTVVPVTALLEIARSAAREVLGEGEHALMGVQVKSPLVLSEGETRRMQLHIHTQSRPTFEVHVEEPGRESFTLHLSGRIGPNAEEFVTADLQALRARCAKRALQETVYASFDALGLRYGPSFRAIAELHLGDGEAVARLRLPETLDVHTDGFAVHPALLEAAMQTMGAIAGTSTEGRLFLPIEIDGFCCRPAAGEVWVQARLRHDLPMTKNDRLAGELTILSPSGMCLGRVSVEFERVEAETYGSPPSTDGAVRSEALVLHARLVQASPADRLAIVETFLLEKVARALHVEPSRIGRTASFLSLGLNSFVALGLRNLLRDVLKIKLPLTLLFTYDNVGSLTSFVLDTFSQSLAVAPSTPNAEAAPEPASDEYEEFTV